MKLGLRNPSQRLPEALRERWLAGDSYESLADDYDIPLEQVKWGIEVAILRKYCETVESHAKGRGTLQEQMHKLGFITVIG